MEVELFEFDFIGSAGRGSRSESRAGSGGDSRNWDISAVLLSLTPSQVTATIIIVTTSYYK